MNAIIKNAARRLVIENVSRRGFLRGAAATGGLVVAAQLLPTKALAYPTGASAMPHGVVTDPHVFVSIAKDGTVTIVAARAEMGTGAARTSLPMMIADELDADWHRVKVTQSPGNEEKYGNQDTDGSRSTRHFIQPMRQIGASVRHMLEAAAAKHWGVAATDVEAKHHQIVNKKTGKKIGYGDVADIAMTMPVPSESEIKLKDPSAFRYIGKGNIKPYDQHDITVGRATYGIDAKVPGMLFAVIEHTPVMGGKVVSYDDSETMKIPGVLKVVKIDGTPAPAKFDTMGGVAVVAKNTWAAMKGRDALKIQWEDGPHGSYDSVAYRAQMKDTASKPCQVVREDGDAEAALKSAAKVVTGEYYLPHISHAQMEPVNATAKFANGKLEVWAPVQSPGGTRDDLAKKLGLQPADVTVNCTLLGGGFGRKSQCDYVIEAALLSKEMNAPVKLIWTREDDIRHDFFHTVSFERIDAGIDDKGKVTAWRHRSVAPTLFTLFVPDPKHESALEMGMGLVDNPFQIANLRCENGEAEAHTRIGWFRSVSNIPHAFAIQTMVAEIAHATNRDPKEVLLELIGEPRIVDPSKSKEVKDYWNYGEPWETFPIDTGRLRGVVELAAQKAGWGKKLPKGHGLGIAAHRSFVTYVATVVEAKVDSKGNLTVPNVWTAIDAGYIVNPERVRSQIEGCAVMGLALAKYGEITFKNGRAEQGNFDTYKVARIDESPMRTEVHIVPHGIDVPPSGVGEPGIPPFAPALCNAIFAATGKRIRELPIGNQLSI
ncbi:MAG TPA: molybdopterin cofactor-binding domain-containing protein [Stellaceae bacterium]|nr:molybdopterin cofactor-binding domain-containing protein [Stellaceae bacterium]